MDWFIYDNDLRDGGVNRVNPGSAVIAFIIVYLIFLEKKFKWNRITFLEFNLLKFAELVLNKLIKSIHKKFTNSAFSI